MKRVVNAYPFSALYLLIVLIAIFLVEVVGR